MRAQTLKYRHKRPRAAQASENRIIHEGCHFSGGVAGTDAIAAVVRGLRVPWNGGFSRAQSRGGCHFAGASSYPVNRNAVARALQRVPALASASRSTRPSVRGMRTPVSALSVGTMSTGLACTGMLARSDSGSQKHQWDARVVVLR